MTLDIAVVMDPIESINVAKDSTLAMLLAAQRRNWRVHYLRPGDLYLRDGTARCNSTGLEVRDDPKDWFTLGDSADRALHEFAVILMRKDPPFDMDFVYATYLLELAEARGALVVNKPSSLRDANEKMFTAWFPELTPVNLVTSSITQMREFLAENEDIVVKPLDGMGGASVFRIQAGDPNVGVILETITHLETRLAMAQRYVPEIVAGDKRILLIDGEPVPFALARIPAAGETRGNLASGGRGESRPLSDNDRRICAAVAPTLRDKGLIFVGLDVIGDYLTEINVTSPTCIRELDKQNGLDIAGQLMDSIERHLA